MRLAVVARGLLVALVVLGVGAPELARAEPAESCAPKRKKKRRKKKKAKPPAEVVPDEDPEIDELSVRDPETAPVPGREPAPEPEPWAIGVGVGASAGFYYAHVIALDRAVTSSAALGGASASVDATSGGYRLGLRLAYAQTTAPSVSVDGNLVGEAFDGLGMGTLTVQFEVLDVWRTLSVGGSAGYLLILNPLHDTPSSGARLGAHALWGFGVVGLGADLGISTIAQHDISSFLGPFRGPVVDFTVGVQAHFDEVGTW
jgi:hypothetical protein